MYFTFCMTFFVQISSSSLWTLRMWVCVFCVYSYAWGRRYTIHTTNNIAIIFIFFCFCFCCCFSFCWHNHGLRDTHTLALSLSDIFPKLHMIFYFFILVVLFFIFMCYVHIIIHIIFKATLYSTNVVLIIKHCDCVLPQQINTHSSLGYCVKGQ